MAIKTNTVLKKKMFLSYCFVTTHVRQIGQRTENRPCPALQPNPTPPSKQRAGQQVRYIMLNTWPITFPISGHGIKALTDPDTPPRIARNSFSSPDIAPGISFLTTLAHGPPHWTIHTVIMVTRSDNRGTQSLGTDHEIVCLIA